MKFPKYRNRELFITGESYAGNFSEDLLFRLRQSFEFIVNSSIFIFSSYFN